MGEAQTTEQQESNHPSRQLIAFHETRVHLTRANSARDYETNLKLHIEPYFSGWELRRIKKETVEAFLLNLVDKGLGRRTVNKCLGLLGQMLRSAVSHLWLHHNVASDASKIPDRDNHRQDQMEGNILLPGEIQLLLDAADDRWRIVILMAVMTGLREGELLGLKWGDIDWNSSTARVRRQFTNGRFSVPKSKLSRRTVNMPPALVDALRLWKLKCPKGDHDLAFPNGKGNPESHSNLLQRGFYPTLRRAKLRKIRFHDFPRSAI